MIEIYRPGEHPNFVDFGYDPVDPWSTLIIPRAEWGALPAKEEIEAMPMPVMNVGFWGAEDIDDRLPGICTTKEECTERVQQMQKKHMDEGLPDIKYNFVIGDDGNIYEGRGWEKRSNVYFSDEEQFKQMNKNMLEIGYIGIHDSRYIHWIMEENLEKLIKQGIEKKFIEDGYRLFDLFSKDMFEEEE